MDIKQLTGFLKIAHRGYSELYPENSLAAFQGAVQAGALMIELDVQLSKDRKPFILHDDTLDRTTDASGLASDSTLQELQQIPAGYRDKFQGQFPEVKIPSLQEVLESVGQKICINIEIKPGAHEPRVAGEAPEDCIEYQVIDLIVKFGLQKSILISCFDPRSLLRIARKAPSLLLGFLTERPLEEEHLKLLTEIKPYSFNPDRSTLTAEEITRIHALSLKIFPYTVTNQEQLQQLYRQNVDGVFLNDLRIQIPLE